MTDVVYLNKQKYTTVVVEEVVAALLAVLLVELFARGCVGAIPEVLSECGPLHTCDGSSGAHENVLAAFSLRPKCDGPKIPHETNREQNASQAIHDSNSSIRQPLRWMLRGSLADSGGPSARVHSYTQIK